MTSSTLLPTISGAPGVIDQTEQSQELEIKAYAKLKKAELAAKVGVELAETGYLPDMLVTPVRVGRFEMTGSGFAVAAEQRSRSRSQEGPPETWRALSLGGEAAISNSVQGEILRNWPYSYGRNTPPTPDSPVKHYLRRHWGPKQTVQPELAFNCQRRQRSKLHRTIAESAGLHATPNQNDQRRRRGLRWRYRPIPERA